MSGRAGERRRGVMWLLHSIYARVHLYNEYSPRCPPVWPQQARRVPIRAPIKRTRASVSFFGAEGSRPCVAAPAAAHGAARAPHTAAPRPVVLYVAGAGSRRHVRLRTASGRPAEKRVAASLTPALIRLAAQGSERAAAGDYALQVCSRSPEVRTAGMVQKERVLALLRASASARSPPPRFDGEHASQAGSSARPSEPESNNAPAVRPRRRCNPQRASHSPSVPPPNPRRLLPLQRREGAPLRARSYNAAACAARRVACGWRAGPRRARRHGGSRAPGVPRIAQTGPPSSAAPSTGLPPIPHSLRNYTKQRTKHAAHPPTQAAAPTYQPRRST